MEIAILRETCHISRMSFVNIRTIMIIDLRYTYEKCDMSPAHNILCTYKTHGITYTCYLFIVILRPKQ